MFSIFCSRIMPRVTQFHTETVLLTAIGMILLPGLKPAAARTPPTEPTAAMVGWGNEPCGENSEPCQGVDTDRVDGIVWAIHEYDDELIVAGQFAQAGGTVVNHIASWDGSTWSPLRGGANDVIWTLAIYDGDLIAGGYFTRVGRVPAFYIGRWDGEFWAQLGSGVNGPVRALTVWQDKLVVGGDFTFAGGSPASKIAQWDGDSWSAMGNGFWGGYNQLGVRAVVVHDDELYAGGFFTHSGSTPVNRIGCWTGDSWEPVGLWTDDTVYSLIHFDGVLIAGSVVWNEGTGSWGDLVLRWDGVTWVSMGDGELKPSFPNAVRTLAEYDGKLFAGGQFIQADGTSVGFVACWNGRYWGAFAHWAPVGFGMNNNVFALTAFDNKLFAGGAFTSAGVEPAEHIAFWDGSAWHGLDSRGPGKVLATNEPNAGLNHTDPWADEDAVSFLLPRVTTLDVAIHDIAGRRIRIIYRGTLPAGRHSFVWEGTDDAGASVARGAYLYRVISHDQTIKSGIIRHQ